MLLKGVGIAVERDGRVFVTEYLGKCFYIHAALEGAGGERVPQGMKAFMRNIQSFQEQFKTSLVGTNGNGTSVCRHHGGRITSLLQPFKNAAAVWAMGSYGEKWRFSARL